MVGDNRNKWTAPQLKLLKEMHVAGRKWPAIASAVGHPLSSCQQMLSRIRGQKRNEEFERARVAPKTPVAIVPPVKPAIVPAIARPAKPSARSTSTARLVMDAELRSRIELQGITAGLLGDPMPGRSALDRKRNAVPR